MHKHGHSLFVRTALNICKAKGRGPPFFGKNAELSYISRKCEEEEKT